MSDLALLAACGEGLEQVDESSVVAAVSDYRGEEFLLLPNILNYYGLYDYSSLKYDGSFGPQKEYEKKLSCKLSFSRS